METISIILLALGTIALMLGIAAVTTFSNPWWGLLPLFGLIMFIIAIIIADKATPDKDDVLQGKAIYQETIHITDNDTIRTYEIVWKQEM